MNIEVSEEPTSALADYARISIAFEVRHIFDVTIHADGPSRFHLEERTLETPYRKDYDAFKEDRPAQWAKRFDLSNWQLFAARLDGRRVGGAAVLFNSPDVTMLEGRRDLALLWDIRVSAGTRQKGIGSALFQAAEFWAAARDCQQMKVETQNVNVAACRFYARQGCVLEAINRSAYPEAPDEIQLLWYKRLAPEAPTRPRMRQTGDRAPVIRARG